MTTKWDDAHSGAETSSKLFYTPISRLSHFCGVVSSTEKACRSGVLSIEMDCPRWK